MSGMEANSDAPMNDRERFDLIRRIAAARIKKIQSGSISKGTEFQALDCIHKLAGFDGNFLGLNRKNIVELLQEIERQ